jgi:hypothetical protein
MEPGVFVCLEAKGYKGKWIGSANERWFSDNQEIKAVGGNPYKPGFLTNPGKSGV